MRFRFPAFALLSFVFVTTLAIAQVAAPAASGTPPPLITPDDVKAVQSAFVGHQWMLLTAVVLTVAVRLLKGGQLGGVLAAVPKRALVWVTLGLGLLSGVVNAGVAGTPWVAAITQGLIAGAVAIATHETVVESARDGKEIGPVKEPAVPAQPPSPSNGLG